MQRDVLQKGHQRRKYEQDNGKASTDINTKWKKVKEELNDEQSHLILSLPNNLLTRWKYTRVVRRVCTLVIIQVTAQIIQRVIFTAPHSNNKSQHNQRRRRRDVTGCKIYFPMNYASLSISLAPSSHICSGQTKIMKYELCYL